MNSTESNEKKQHDTVAVRVSTTAGFWPSEDTLIEVKKDTHIREILEKAAAALNIASTSDYIAKVNQHKIDVNQTFAEAKLDCIIDIDYSKIVKGGGSHPLVTKKEVEKELSKLTPTFLKQRGWEVLVAVVPLLKVKFSASNREDLIIDVGCADFPTTPASYIFKNGQDQIITSIPNVNGGFINMSPHPNSQSAFICAPGALEYHTHSSHLNDQWDNYRLQLDEYGLVAMLSKIYNFWLSEGNK